MWFREGFGQSCGIFVDSGRCGGDKITSQRSEGKDDSLRVEIECRNREKTEKDLRILLSDKDSENVRLRAEINRLRSTLEKTDKLHSSQAEEVQTERQAVLAAASSSGSGSPDRRELHQLIAELAAKDAQVSRLEAELSSQAELASTREELRSKSEEVVRLKAQLDAQQQLVADLNGQLASLPDQLKKSEREVGRLADQVRTLTDEKRCAGVRTLTDEKRSLQQQLQEAAQAPAGPATSSGIDADMLAMMEGQLMNLSGIIRNKEGEMAGLMERKDLMAQMEAQRKQQELQLQPPVLSPKSASGASSHGALSPNSQKNGLGHNGAHKPYRSGLMSKPKFK
eukprot:gene8768-33635_t